MPRHTARTPPLQPHGPPLDLHAFVHEDPAQFAKLSGAHPDSIGVIAPGIVRWTVEHRELRGRMLLARLGEGLAALLTDYTCVEPIAVSARGDGLLMLQLRLEGEVVVDDAPAKTAARAALTCFPPGSLLDWRVGSAGRWRSLALVATPAALDARWGLGTALLAALGVDAAADPSAADGRDPAVPRAVLRRAWQVTRDGLDVLRALLDCRLQGAVARAYFDARLAQLVCEFLASGPAPASDAPPSAHVREALRRARALLLKDPARPHTLISVAREVGLGRTVLAERFHREFGETVHDCMTRERLRLAWDALSASDQKIASVAASVGYASSASFARAFKAQFGVTPREVGARQERARPRAGR